MTVAFWNKYCDEAHALLAKDWLTAKGAPSGFDQDRLPAPMSTPWFDDDGARRSSTRPIEPDGRERRHESRRRALPRCFNTGWGKRHIKSAVADVLPYSNRLLPAARIRSLGLLRNTQMSAHQRRRDALMRQE